MTRVLRTQTRPPEVGGALLEKHFSYLPGLDGLRALAVAAVLLYHAGISPVAGGFLGVEVFFVISGYLITCVLLSDRERDGRINLGRFWFRRARRLLPALFVLLLGTLAAAVPFYREEVTELRSDTLAALGYATNWYLIADSKPYFEAVGRPPLLQHLWSLAIEVQFYLLWPLIFALLVGRLHRTAIVFLLVGVAAASTVLMAVLWHPGVEPTRVYYGTDTRATGLLIGAALAFVWAPWSVTRPAAGSRLTIGLELAGVVALVALVYLHLRLDQYEAFLYRGGFALVAALTVLTIAIAVHPRCHLGLFLGRQPLRWLGTRSYAVYLWHWPVFMLTRPNVDISMDGAELLALRLGITFALAEVSYRLVEQPVRSGALGRAWRAYRDGHGRQRWLEGVRWSAPVGAAASAAAVLAVFAISAQPPAPPPYLSVRSVNIVSPVRDAGDETERDATPPATQDPTTAIPAPGVSEPGSEGTAPPGPARAGANATAAYGRPSGVTVTALGDSVMVGAAPELARAMPGAEVNAEIGRQASAALDILRQRSAAGALGDAVVIHVGNNGTFTSSQFDGMMQILAERRVVVFVNIKVPRAWEGSNNGVIAGGVSRYRNAALVDWYGVSAGRPELFYSDGIHLRPEGVSLYTALITQELAKHPPPPPPAAAPAEPPPADAPPSGDTPPPAGDPPPGEEPPPPDTPPPNAPPTPPVAHTPTPTPAPEPQPTEPPTPEPNPAPEPTPAG
jgi:peptidoglycan/LPS O-acetylase OafA/YrhL